MVLVCAFLGDDGLDEGAEPVFVASSFGLNEINEKVGTGHQIPFASAERSTAMR